MNDQEKTKEQLIKELQYLQQKYISLETLHNKNITEYKQTEKALQLNEHKFSDMVLNSPDVVYQFQVKKNGTLNFTFMSPKATEIFGIMSDPSALEWNPQRDLHPDDVEPFVLTVGQSISEVKPHVFEGRFITKGTVWFRASARPTVVDDVIIFNGIMTDITERKQLDINLKEKNKKLEARNEEYKQLNDELQIAKEKAEESERNLKESQAIARLGGWELDIDSGIFTFTDNLLKIYHTNIAELGGYQMTINEYATRFVHPDDAAMVEEETLKALETDNPNFSNYVEHRIKYFDGGIGYIGVKYFIKKDENGRTIKTFGVNQDITEKKLTEQELIAAKEKAEESDKLKSAFLANLSHEIRTPMNGILGFAQLIADKDTPEEKRNQYGDIIKQSCNQLLNVINDIIDISKIETNQIEIKMSTVHLNFLLNKLCVFFEPLLRKKDLKIQYKTSLPDQESIITTDETKLNQIINNLLINAIKFTETGSIEIGYNLQENMLQFYVKDTGIGIPKEYHQLIFGRFRQIETSMTRKYGGSGLGLAISKSYINLLGGNIWVESESGLGSTFYFSIPYRPIRQPDQIRIKDVDNQTSGDNKILNILVVEDDEINFLFLNELLSGFQTDVIRANDGKEAVDIFKENQDIDLVLMDINMPVMNGIEATKIIKSIRNVPIIAVTAYALAGDKEKFLEAGCDGYLSKPVRIEDLTEVIHKFKNQVVDS